MHTWKLRIKCAQTIRDYFVCQIFFLYIKKHFKSGALSVELLGWCGAGVLGG